MSGEFESAPSPQERLDLLSGYSDKRLQQIADLEARGEILEDITPQSALAAVVPHLEFKLLILKKSLEQGRITQVNYDLLCNDVQIQLTTFGSMDPGTTYFDALRIFHEYEMGEMRRDIIRE